MPAEDRLGSAADHVPCGRLEVPAEAVARDRATMRIQPEVNLLRLPSVEINVVSQDRFAIEADAQRSFFA